jgi:hypothetical protein
MTNWSVLPQAGAVRRRPALRIRSKVSSVQRRARSREPVIPTRIRNRNRHHHKDQDDRSDAHYLKGRENSSFTSSNLVIHLLSGLQALTTIWAKFAGEGWLTLCHSNDIAIRLRDLRRG